MRNLKTGFISPQFYVIYDNAFQIVMRDCEDNKTVVKHLYDKLAGSNDAVENVVDQVTVELNFQRVIPIPPLHKEWLSEN